MVGRTPWDKCRGIRGRKLKSGAAGRILMNDTGEMIEKIYAFTVRQINSGQMVCLPAEFQVECYPHPFRIFEFIGRVWNISPFQRNRPGNPSVCLGAFCFAWLKGWPVELE